MGIGTAIILGIVEGLTEFLPVSSTGHLILVSQFLKVPESEFLKSFYIAIQLGAILSVVILYARTLVFDLKLMKKVLAAFLPAAVIGFGLYRLIKKFLLGNAQVVFWAFILGGIVLIVFELLYREKKESSDSMGAITYPQALLIGLFQCLAMVPGVSRSAATIIGGLSLGLKRRVVVEFSFLLAIPTMLAATALDLAKSARAFTGGEFVLLGVGFITSFAVALLAVKLLLVFVRRHNLIVFGIYRIIAGTIFLFLFR